MPVVIAVAGMEASLPSVVGGQVPGLVVAVPTSNGYGVSAGGRVALDASLSSCAPGLAVVNIDNGYGAACVALRGAAPRRTSVLNAVVRRVPRGALRRRITPRAGTPPDFTGIRTVRTSNHGDSAGRFRAWREL